MYYIVLHAFGSVSCCGGVSTPRKRPKSRVVKQNNAMVAQKGIKLHSHTTKSFVTMLFKLGQPLFQSKPKLSKLWESQLKITK